MATLWIVIAAVFDFGDGFAARSLHAYSPMGKELDSLSDMVSFGVNLLFVAAYSRYRYPFCRASMYLLTESSL